MCQVNTDPMRSEKGYLEVVGKTLLRMFKDVQGCISMGSNKKDTDTSTDTINIFSHNILSHT